METQSKSLETDIIRQWIDPHLLTAKPAKFCVFRNSPRRLGPPATEARSHSATLEQIVHLAIRAPETAQKRRKPHGSAVKWDEQLILMRERGRQALNQPLGGVFLSGFDLIRPNPLTHGVSERIWCPNALVGPCLRDRFHREHRFDTRIVMGPLHSPLNGRNVIDL